MRGVASRTTLLEFAAGFLIDVRTRDAPVPAANRLFFDRAESAKIMVPLSRAFLRTAIHLWLQGGRNEAWTVWLEELLVELTGGWYGREVAFFEAARLRELLDPEIIEDGRARFVRIDDIRQEFGRWVPIASDRNRGLSRRRGRTALLFGDKPHRVRDGIVEIDLDSTRDAAMTTEEWERVW